MTSEAQNSDAPRPRAPLGFGIDIEDGVGTLTLGERGLPFLARLERLSMEVPNLRFPFRLSGGLAGFRNRRCTLRELVLSVGALDLRRFLSNVALGGFGIERPVIELGAEDFALGGRAEIGSHGADFCATGTFRVVNGRRLSISLFDVRVYGFLPVAAPTLMAATLASLAGRRDPDEGQPAGPMRRARGRGRVIEGGDVPRTFVSRLPRSVSLVGPTELHVDVLDLVLCELLPPRGWRLPNRAHVRLEPLRNEGGRLRLVFRANRDRDDEFDGFGLPTPGSRSSALASYDEGRTLFPDGEQALLSGDLGLAAEIYRRAATLHPQNLFVAERLLQTLLASTSTFKEAEELASALLARRPGFAPALLARAVVAGETGRPEVAAGLYERLGQEAVQLPSLDAACALTAAAELRARAGHAEAAHDLLQSVRHARPAHARALDVLRLFYEQQGRHHDWLAVLRQRELDEPDPVARARLLAEAARIHLEDLNQPAQAGERYAQAVILDDHEPAHWQGLGKSQAAAGDAERALESLERGRQLYEGEGDRAGEGEALRTAAGVFESLGQDEAASRHYARALERLGESPALVERYGRVLARVGEVEQAVNLLERAIASARERGEDQSLKVVLSSIVREMQGQRARARVLLEEVLQVEPDHLGALEELALLAGDDDLQDVLICYRRAINRCEDGVRLDAILKRGRELAARAGRESFLREALTAAAQSTMAGGAQAARLLARMALESARAQAPAEPAPVSVESWKDVIAIVERHVRKPGVGAAGVRAELAQLLAALKERAGDDEGAIAALELCLKSDAQHEIAVAAWRRMVELKARRGDAAGAARALIASADDVRTGQPPKARASLLVAAAEILRERLGMVDDAVPLLDRATMLDPHNGAAFEALEDAATQANDWERLADVISRRAGNARLTDRRTQLGRLAEVLSDKLGRVEEARVAFQRALDVDPDYVPALLWLARHHWNLADTAQSIEYYRRLALVGRQGLGRSTAAAIRDSIGGATSAQSAEAHLRVAQIARVMGRLAEAESHLDRALSGEPDGGAPLSVLVDALDSLGEHDTLIRILRQRAGVADGADRVEIQRELARALERHGRSAEAVQIYERRLADAPDDEDTLQRLADLYRRESRWADMVPVLERLLVLTQEQGTGVDGERGVAATALTVDLARALWQSGQDVARAEALLSELLARDAGNREAAETLGRVLLSRSEWDAADEVLARAGIVTRPSLDAPSPGVPVAAAADASGSDDITALVREAQARLQGDAGDVAAYAVLRPLALERLPPEALALRGELAQRLADHVELAAVIARWRELTDGGRAPRWRDDGLRLAAAAARDPSLRETALELIETMALSGEAEPPVLDALAGLYGGIDDPRLRAPGLNLLMLNFERLSSEARAGLLQQLVRLAEREGDLQAALALLERGLSAPLPDAVRADSLVKHATLLVTRKDIEGAVADLEEALSIVPDHAPALGLLGDISYRAQDWTQARRAYSALARLGGAEQVIPPAVLAYRRAELAESFGDEVEAEACYRQTVALDARHTAAREALAQIALYRNDHEEAIRWLDEVLRVSPLEAVGKLIAVRERLAGAYLRVGQPDKARAQLAMVLAEEPDRLRALELMAAALEGLQAYREAAALWGRLSRLLEAGRARAEALYRQGELLRVQLGDRNAADDAYLRSADMDPTFVPTMVRLVHHYWDAGDLVGAAEVGVDLLKTDDGRAALDGEVGLMVALAAVAGPRDRGLGHQALPRELPKRGVLVKRLAQLARRLAGEPPAALDAALELVGERAPEGAERLDEVRAGVREVLQTNPADTGALALLGRACERSGRTEAARAAYGVLLFVDPESRASARLETLGPENPCPAPALALDASVHPLCAGPARRVLTALAARLVAFDASAPSEVRPDPDSEWSRVLQGLSQNMQTPAVRALAGEGGTIELVAGLPVGVAVGPGLFRLPRPELTFYLAVALEQVRSATFVLERVGRARFLDLFRSIAAALQGRESVADAQSPLAGALAAWLCEQDRGGRLPTGVARETVLADALEVLEAPPDFDSFLLGCRHTANRVGLLACAEPMHALRAAQQVLRASDARDTDPNMAAIATVTEEFGRPGSPLRELALFALSVEYRDLVAPPGAVTRS